MCKKRGFTLIELLVVVLIIGILAAVAVPQYQKAVTKSRYVQAMTLADGIAKGVNLYYMANGDYPTSLQDLDLTIPNELDGNTDIVSLNGYVCRLFMHTSASDSIMCWRGASTDAQYLAYRIMFGGRNDGKRFCAAYENNPTAINLCLSLGGKFSYVTDVGLRHYEL